MQTVWTNTRLVDGTGQPAVERGTLVTEDDRIAWCGPDDAPDRPEPAGARVVDLGGLTLLPGLFNAHAHLGARLPHMAKRLDFLTPGYRVMLNYRRALEALWTGATTVRVTGEGYGSDVDVKEAINRGLVPGPRLLVAGQALTPTGGHGHQNVACLECDGPQGFRVAVREQIRAGADLVKICVTGSVAGGEAGEAGEARLMSDDEIRAAVEVAHAFGRPITAHTGGSEAIQTAVRLGVDCIEHGFSLDDETARVMAEAGTFLVPTLSFTHEPEYLRSHGMPEARVQATIASSGEHHASIERAVRAGVVIASGTDILPSDNVSGTTATIREVEHLASCGLAPLQAIQAATLNAARVARVDKVAGTLEAGKQADLVAVAGRPDERIEDLRNLRLVVKAGRVIRNEVAGFSDPGLATAGVTLAGGLDARTW